MKIGNPFNKGSYDLQVAFQGKNSQQERTANISKKTFFNFFRTIKQGMKALPKKILNFLSSALFNTPKTADEYTTKSQNGSNPTFGNNRFFAATNEDRQHNIKMVKDALETLAIHDPISNVSKAVDHVTKRLQDLPNPKNPSDAKIIRYILSRMENQILAVGHKISNEEFTSMFGQELEKELIKNMLVSNMQSELNKVGIKLDEGALATTLTIHSQDITALITAKGDEFPKAYTQLTQNLVNEAQSVNNYKQALDECLNEVSAILTDKKGLDDISKLKDPDYKKLKSDINAEAFKTEELAKKMNGTNMPVITKDLYKNAFQKHIDAFYIRIGAVQKS